MATKSQIESLMKKHHLLELYMGGASTAVVIHNDGEWVLTFGDLPQLTFFIDLAKLCEVPLEKIKTKSDEHGGCDTCGYGAGTEITVTVPDIA